MVTLLLIALRLIFFILIAKNSEEKVRGQTTFHIILGKRKTNIFPLRSVIKCSMLPKKENVDITPATLRRKLVAFQTEFVIDSEDNR